MFHESAANHKGWRIGVSEELNLFKSLPFEMNADKAKDRQKERLILINAVQPYTDSLVTIEHW